MKCTQHQFFEIKKLEHFQAGARPMGRPDREGVLIVCGLCGARREVWETGQIDNLDAEIKVNITSFADIAKKKSPSKK